MFVIGLHGSGDKMSLFVQDWKLAKVELNCHIVLDMLCLSLSNVVERIFVVLNGMSVFLYYVVFLCSFMSEKVDFSAFCRVWRG